MQSDVTCYQRVRSPYICCLQVGVAQEHIDDAVVVLMSTRPIFDTVAKN